MPTTRPGEGTLLQIKIVATYTTIGLMEEFDGPEVTAAAIKKTHLASTVHEYRKSGIPDPGKLTGKLQLDPDDATQQLLYDHMTDPDAAVDDWKIVFVDDQVVPASCQFFGFVTKFKVTGEKIEENLMAEFEIQLTSLPIFTPGAAS